MTIGIGNEWDPGDPPEIHAKVKALSLVRKKPLTVTARQVTEPELVLTAHGRVRAEAGDWILRDPDTGDTWPVKPDIFAATYEDASGLSREELQAENAELRSRLQEAEKREQHLKEVIRLRTEEENK